MVEPAAVITELGGALDGDSARRAAFAALPPGKPIRSGTRRAVRAAWQHRNVRGALSEAAELAARTGGTRPPPGSDPRPDR